MSDQNIRSFTVSEQHANLRLDLWLTILNIVPSRNRASELIRSGFVTSQGKTLKASYKVQAQVQIEVRMPEESPDSELVPLPAPLNILFQDQDVVVINKPSGLVVHPAAGHAQDTLVNIMLHHIDNLAMGFGENRPGIVHRLDRDTSGVIVVAKNDIAHRHLADQFKNKSVHRIYWAVVKGQPKKSKGRIESFLARHPTDRKRFASHPKNGKLAITHYECLQVIKPSTKDSISWLKLQLETGRTHQIRVHLSELGHPVLGDPIYNRRDNSGLSRLALHACELGFVHPRSGQELRFCVPWPAQLLSELESLGLKP